MCDYKPDNVKRILLKISGEYLGGASGFGFDQQVLNDLTSEIIEVAKLGYEIGIVIGGGNFFRGKDLTSIDRAAADNVGMLTTIQNAIVVSEIIKQKSLATELFAAFPIDKIGSIFTYHQADIALRDGKICFFTGGTGNPFFTTDTAAVLRAIELKCDLVLKGTKVDGVYTADPKTDPTAVFIKNISYSEALQRQLHIMDMTAFSLALDYEMPVKVFNITKKGNMKRAILSPEVGSYIHT